MKRFLRLAVSSMVAAAISMSASGPVNAEGTRTLHPAAGDGSTGNRGVMDVSNTVNAGVVRTRQFLYVYAEAGEVILLGSRNRSNGGDIFVYNPQSFGARGNEAIPGAADFTCSNQAGRGTIASRTAELAGPNSADLSQTVTNGFDPCSYTAPTTGIYGVRFTAATSGGGTNDALIATPRVLDGNRVSAWDVTVRANASSLTDLNARVFTYAWTVYLQNNGRVLNNALRYVSTDGFRYRQTFRGLDPNRATFYANAQGFIDAGAPLYRDVRGNDQTVAAGPSFSAGVTAQAPQYPIFFSDVAQGGPNAVEVNKVLTALAIPTAPLQPQLSNPQFVGNLSGNQSTVSAGGVFTFDTLNTLTYEIVISLDGVNFDPANVNNRVLTGTALSGSHSVLWDGLNNNAVPFPAGSYDFRIYGRNGEIHFPMLDVEGNANGGPTLEKLNGFQPADAFTVYYDDRGYRTANATVIGVLNGHLCGATSPIAQPTPTHSLVGVDSSAGGPGTYYRRWSGSSDTNVDCDNDANEYFATAKGLDLWALERSPVQELPLVIVPLSSGIDVGTQAGATSSVLPGGTAFGSFSFTNAGDTTATGVNYSVTIGNPGSPATCPASVNFTLLPAGVTATYNPALCTVTFTGMPTSLTPGQTLNFNFNYVVAPTNPGPIPVNTSISAGNENCTINCAPNSASAQTMVATPVITIAKTANPVSGSNVNVGSLIEYTVAVTIGNAPLTAVLSLDDTLSAGLAFGSVISAHPSFDCSSAPDCTLPTGTAIGTYTVVYSATVTGSASPVSNNVAGSGGGDLDGPACTPAVGGCATQHNVNLPNLVISKTASVASAVVGDNFSYTLTVTNTGSAATTAAAVVTDTIPAGLTIGTLPAGCVLNPPASQTVECTIASGLAASGGQVSFVIPVTATATAVPSVTNTASVTGGGDPDCVAAGDCSHPPVNTPVGAPVLTLTKSAVLDNTVVAPNDQSNPGDTIAYTVTVVNSGNGPATNVVVTDPLVTLSCLPASGSTLAASATMTCTGTYTLVAGDVGNGSVSNTATVAGGNVCNPTTVGSTCSDTEVTPLGLVPVLTLTKSAVPNPFVVGQAASYSITVTNNGNAPTTANIVVTDTLPTGISLASANGTNWSCAGTTTLTCTFTGTLVVSGSTTLTLNVSVSASATNGDNTATASGGGDPTCPAAARCTDTVIVPVNAPNLSIVKAGPASATVGVAYNYTLTVDNTGTADATANATVTDTVPTGLTINSAGPGCTTVGQLVTCTIAAADLQVPDPAVVITINVTPTATATSPINNSATVTGGGDPDCTVGCGSNVVITTLGSPIADLAIVKTAPANSTVGQNVTFTIVVTNNGPNTATATMLTDPTPVGLQFVSNSGDCVTAFPCALGDLAVGASRTIQATFLIPVGYSGPSTIMNTATVTSSSTDPTPGDTSSSASTVVSLVPTFQPPAVIPVDARWALALLVGLMTLLAGWSLTRRG